MAKIEKNSHRTDRLQKLNESYVRKRAVRNEYDKVIKELESAYSSQSMLHLLARQTVSCNKAQNRKLDKDKKSVYSSAKP